MRSLGETKLHNVSYYAGKLSHTFRVLFKNFNIEIGIDFLNKNGAAVSQISTKPHEGFQIVLKPSVKI